MSTWSILEWGSAKLIRFLWAIQSTFCWLLWKGFTNCTIIQAIFESRKSWFASKELGKWKFGWTRTSLRTIPIWTAKSSVSEETKATWSDKLWTLFSVTLTAIKCCNLRFRTMWIIKWLSRSASAQIGSRNRLWMCSSCSALIRQTK